MIIVQMIVFQAVINVGNNMSAPLWFILENKRPKIVTAEEAEKFMNTPEKIIHQTRLSGVFISTVFLCLDYNMSYDSTIPILFETMVDGLGKESDIVERYTTYQEASNGHWKYVGHALMRVMTGEWKD